MPDPFFAHTIQQREDSGRILSELLSVCPSLVAVCRYLQRWNMKPHQSHICGWEPEGRQRVISTEELERAIRGED
jgi:hypothetical protein